MTVSVKSHKIALTGNCMSGKSSVAQLFRKIEIPVFDADAVLKYLINYAPTTIDKARAILGTDHVFQDFINPVTIQSDDTFNRLVSIVETDLFDAYDNYRMTQTSGYAIFESSILFERGWDTRFDNVIMVTSPIDERAYRYSLVKGCSKESAMKILNREIPQDEKKSKSFFVISNDGNSPDIREQVEEIDMKIVRTMLKRNETNIYST